jgi:hypothetical protein
MQKQKVPKRTFEELPKPDIYKSYRQAKNRVGGGGADGERGKFAGEAAAS